MESRTSQQNDEFDGLPLSRRSVDTGTTGDRGNRRKRRRGYTSTECEKLTIDGVRRRVASETALSAENSALFEDLTRMADTDQPVHLDTFRRGSSTGRNSLVGNSGDTGSSLFSQVRPSGSGEVHSVIPTEDSGDHPDDGGGGGDDKELDTELLDAYIAYCRSVGHEPNIQIDPGSIIVNPQVSGDMDERDTGVTYVHERAVLPEHTHVWTKFIGTRYSKRRGCTQFWAWMLIGVGVLLWLGISLSSLQLNEVLHLEAFTVQNVQVTEDYTFLHFLEEVDFHLTYTIETPNPSTLSSSANPNSSYFNALLLNEYEYEHYTDGEPFQYIAAGSKLRTTYAYLPRTYIDNTIEETMYFVVQSCYLERNPTADYCNTSQLPTSVSSSEKIYNLNQKKKMQKKAAWEHFNITYMSVNPMPIACSSSGIVGGAYLLLFLPYLLITLFGIRVFQMIRHCESFQKNIERIYAREQNIPENEVDYWQPMPWDRKIPKTRLCGPCCWKKFRRPFEPFYTWWRHENYFTWVFCPYRNERLSRGERALIVVCSLYVTFYVLFIIVMVRDSWGSDMTIFTSVVMYAVLTSTLPSAGKAVFKELFKLIFRQRRKYFRAKAEGRDLKGFSFRLAFLLQVLVVLLLTLAQAPIFYIWARRSCLFLKNFIYYGVLSAILRLSLMGVAQDFAWYLIIQTWGWKDLCPLCTERIKHCDCFNDEVLVLAVERLGPKWELIRVLDGIMAKQNSFDSQFEPYTPDQLRERWDVIVERAEKHMEKIEKLRVYKEKRRLDELHRDRSHRNLTTLLSRRGSAQVHSQNHGCSADPNQPISSDNTDDTSDDQRAGSSESNFHLCSIREKKILELNSKIKLDAFEKHYDSNISDVFHMLTHSVMKHRRHEKHEHQRSRPETGNSPRSEDGGDDRSPRATRQSSGSSDGETMWVFDTPEQRLARREEEKLQRKRAFRVLNDYDIKSIPPATSQQESAPATGASPPPSKHRDSKETPLLSPRNNALPVTSQDQDLVLVVSDASNEPENTDFDEPAFAQVNDYNIDDLERGQADSRASSTPPPSTNRAYTVTEKSHNLLRRVSSSAFAFAAWALDYDPNVKY